MSNFQKFFGGTMGVVLAILIGGCCVVSVPVACVMGLGGAKAIRDAAKNVQERQEAK